MKVLLVKPRYRNAFTKLSLITTEPLELEYMSAICQRHGVQARICDLTIRGRGLRHMLRTFRPDMVVMTANFVHIHSVQKYVRQIKGFDPKIITMVGGPHAEVMTEDLQLEGMDIVCHSGGFQPFETIISDPEHMDLSKIRGICYHQDGQWHRNQVEQFDPDALPMPDRTHFYAHKKSYKYVTMSPCAIVKAAYSCPHSCNYCFSTLLNGGRYRCRDPKKVVQEIKSIDCQDIWIVDDTFYVNQNDRDTFIREMKAQGVDKRLSLYYRADFIASHPDYMEQLAQVGVTMCAVGLEVIDDETLKKYEKKSSVDIILRALEVLKNCGITCIGLFMVDIDADVTYFDELYRFIKRHSLYLSTISILTPMPGTKQFQIYKDRLITFDHRKWDFIHLTIEPTKMSKFTFYRRFYGLYVKLAMLIVKNRVLSLSYIRSAIAASFDYWVEAFRGMGGKRR